MAPQTKAARDNSSSGGNVPRSPGAFNNSSAALALMGQNKLTTEAGMAAASHAAAQSKLRAQQKQQEELQSAALTPPQQRNHEQVEILCKFLSSAHLLKNLQPTNIKDLAQTMLGRHFNQGELIYSQHESAKHFYIVLSGEVVMYEADSGSSATKTEQQQQQQQQQQENKTISQCGTPPSSLQKSSTMSVSSSGSKTATVKSQNINSPRQKPGSTAAAQKQAAAAAAAAAGNVSTAAAGSSTVGSTPRVHADTVAGCTAGCDMIEVRRVGPREAFGEDDVTTGCQRQQTAVAGGATTSTWNQVTTSGTAAATISGTAAVASIPGYSIATAAAVPSDGSSSSNRSLLDARRPAVGFAAVDCGAIVLQLSSDDYGAVLEGRLSAMLEEKVTFLGDLPALKGLSSSYLRSLAHCFHQVQFEPREIVTRQGDASDCMFVLKSGQVCVLINPNLTLTECGAMGASADTPALPAAGSSSSNQNILPGDNEVDLKKLVQVCLLGSGSIIGDMSLKDGSHGAPKRSATVVALTELLTYKVPLSEFKRRMPAEVLEGMRQVARQKLVMNEQKATSRTAAAAAGREGHILLGGLPVPEAVLHGKELRSLMYSQQSGGPVENLLDALEVVFASNSSKTPTAKPPNSLYPSRGAGAADSYLDSLTRNGFITAPPAEFLALLTDWKSSKNAAKTTSIDRKVPISHQFPLPIPEHNNCTSPKTVNAAASSAAHYGSSSSRHEQSLMLNTSASPLVNLTTSGMMANHSKEHGQLPGSVAHQHQIGSNINTCNSASWNRSGLHTATLPTVQVDTYIPTTAAAANSAVAAASSNALGAGSSPRWDNIQQQQQQQLVSPVSTTTSFRNTLDQLVVQKQQQLLQHGSPRYDSTSGTTTTSSSSSPKSALCATAVLREARQQMMSASCAGVTSDGRGRLGPVCGGGFKGGLVKAALASLSCPVTQHNTDTDTAQQITVIDNNNSNNHHFPLHSPSSTGGGNSAKQHVAATAGEPHLTSTHPLHKTGNWANNQPHQARSTAAAAAAVHHSSSSGPSLHNAQVAASHLFRPGSPIAVGNKQQQGLMISGGGGGGGGGSHGIKSSKTQATTLHVHHTAVDEVPAVMSDFTDSINAAVVINKKGELQLDFHAGDVM